MTLDDRPSPERRGRFRMLLRSGRYAVRAASRGAPSLPADVAAQALGVDRAELAANAPHVVTGSGLNLDQAKAAYQLLTSDQRAEILVGPAGSGKTHTAAKVAQVWWRAGMGKAVWVTTSRAARDDLLARGVSEAYSTADFLGSREGEPDARSMRTVEPGSLLILDGASTMPAAAVAKVSHLAAVHGCKVVMIGDRDQLDPAGFGAHGVVSLATGHDVADGAGHPARLLARLRSDRRGADRLAGWSAQALTGIAGSLAGPRHPHLRDAWNADLDGDPEQGSTPTERRRLRLAAGFVAAAIRCRVDDAADLAWRPVERLLASRRASAVALIAPTVVAMMMVVSREGIYGLVTNAENLTALGALPYLAIKAGRRYRRIDPPKRAKKERPRTGGHR